VSPWSLPQSARAPNGITVADLVARGRYPHQSFLSHWSEKDKDAEGSDGGHGHRRPSGRLIYELSGRQPQRVRIATVLAQETPILFRYEPTTFLDIVATLNEQGRTVVAVLHDINQACRHSTNLVAMKVGKILAEGKPAETYNPTSTLTSV
jgi:iron complex transport system ATP-binding protein